MSTSSLIIHSERAVLTGWRYFWAKRVRGFNASRHCAQCLVGEYVRAVGREMPVNESIDLSAYTEGDILYFCGVSAPYRWANNMHLAVRLTGKDDEIARVDMFTGDTMTVIGARKIEFSGATAEREFEDRGPSFTTCRNFQFGAQMVAEGTL